MSASGPIDGVFFDLGGTLFRYGGRQGDAVRFVLESVGAQVPREDIRQAWNAASRAASEQYAPARFFLQRDVFRATLEHFLAGLGHDTSEDLFEAFHQRQLQGVLEHLPIRETCVSTLQALRDRGLYLSIVSNIDDDYLYPLLDRHQLRPLFHHITSSEEAGSCKPDAAIFHLAMEKAGLDASRVLFVGDSLHHDVAGAARVGMRSAHITEHGVEAPLTHGLSVVARPTYEIDDLDRLVTILDASNP